MKHKILVFGDDFEAMTAFAGPVRNTRDRHKVLFRSALFYQGDKEHCDEVFVLPDAANVEAIRAVYGADFVKIVGFHEPAADLSPPDALPPPPPKVPEVIDKSFEQMKDAELRQFINEKGATYGIRAHAHAKRPTLLQQATNVQRAVEAYEQSMKE